MIENNQVFLNLSGLFWPKLCSQFYEPWPTGSGLDPKSKAYGEKVVESPWVHGPERTSVVNQSCSKISKFNSDLHHGYFSKALKEPFSKAYALKFIPGLLDPLYLYRFPKSGQFTLPLYGDVAV